MRLIEQYQIGVQVDILLGDGWVAGEVVDHQFPAVWVKTTDGLRLFVTNGQRIRTMQAKNTQKQIHDRLVALNKHFYAECGAAFAQSRKRPWLGFDEMLEHIPQQHLSVMDVGCGEGRLGRYLHQNDRLSSYIGVDFSTTLLGLAEVGEAVPLRWAARDLMDEDCLRGLGRVDFIACIATMQHIPGYANRLRLLKEMAAHLTEGGHIAIANWQPLNNSRQLKKRVPAQQLGFDEADLEPGDCFIAWQRVTYGVRYVTQIDAAQTALLAEDASLTITHQFRSDGKEKNLNLYTIFKKDVSQRAS